MLKALDVLIGFSLVMFILSLAVTAVTQIAGHILRLRSRNLVQGIRAILGQIDPGLQGHANALAGQVLRHPLLSEAPGRFAILRRGATVIQREELVRILLGFAAANGTDAEKALRQALSRRGVHDPEQVLRSISLAAIEIEEARPDIAAHVRHTMATIREAKSEFVGTVHAWFDQAMDRTADRFVLHIRWCSMTIAAVVALGLQFDSFELLKQLSVDSDLRSELVALAVEQAKEAKPEPSGDGVQGGPDPQVTAPQEAHLPAASASVGEPTATPVARASAPPSPTPAATRTGAPAEPSKTPAADRRRSDGTREAGTTPEKADEGGSGADGSPAEPSGAQGSRAEGSAAKTGEAGGEANQELAARLQAARTGIEKLSRAYTLVPGEWKPEELRYRIPGILLTWILLTLGAPFWFNALKSLVNLRPILAGKEQEQRESRQNEPGPSAGGSTGASAPAKL